MNWRLASAHALSLIGHPLALMPATVWIASGPAREADITPLAVALGVAMIVLLFSLARVRAGRWKDADASETRERRELNGLLAPLLLGAAALAFASGQAPALIRGLALGGAIIVIAILARNRVKLSLHCAFAVFALFLAWPNLAASIALGAFAVAVAWSRLALKRHTPADIAAGAAAGALAGLVFVMLG